MCKKMSHQDYPENAIEIRNLTKIYGKKSHNQFKALDDVSLSIKRGSIFALLGPNGAGKSTLINILAGLVVKTSGYASIWGIDIDKDHRNAKSCIGIVPQELNIDPYFQPRRLLDLQAGLYGLAPKERRTDEILKTIGLEDKANTYARNLSGGMRRRLLVGKAMVHSPPILVLDEPTAGVDIELRKKLWDNVRHLNKEGVTILLTTHYLEEAEELCDQIAIINKGKLIVNEKKSTLMTKIDIKSLVIHVQSVPVDKEKITIEKCDLVWHMEGEKNGVLEVSYPPSIMSAGKVIEKIQQYATITDISTKEPDLEDIFMKHVY